MSTIPSNIKNDIIDLITSFHEKFEPEVEKYRHLDIIDRSVIPIEDFYNVFVACHSEIRDDCKTKGRYFIMKKANKLHKISVNKLPENDIIDSMCDSTVDFYWDTLHHIYILLENCMDEKDQTVINTIASEISKHNEQMESLRALELENQAKKDKILAKKAEAMERKMEKIDMPDISTIMDSVKDPKMMEMIQKMAGGADIEGMLKGVMDKNSGADLNGMLKGVMGENTELVSMMGTLLDSYNNGDKSMDMNNLSSMIGSVVPTIDHTCQVNVILINKIYQDLLYIYEKQDANAPVIDKRIVTTVDRYMALVAKGSLKVEELIGCLWKVANDEDKQKYVVEMEKEVITGPTIKKLIKKYVPKMMLDQVPMDIDTIVDSIFAGNMADLSSIFDMAKQYMSGGDVEVEKLSDIQMANLADHYDRMMETCHVVDPDMEVPSSSSKQKKVRKTKK